ncbi:MAG: putative molybdenum carrier protein [Pseudomonadota bacterium]
MNDVKIISGAQTGVDRGALDAALEVGVSCGGWCPKGRRAEDGRIPDKYPVIELSDSRYRQRTLHNVLHSDATLIIYFSILEGGTELTVLYCMQHAKPYKLIDAQEIPSEQAVRMLQEFVSDQGVKILNVAGPRASHQPKAHRYTFDVLLGFFLL